MTDDPAARLRRLRIRCWRRGTKEMDLLLGPYADALAEGRAAADLDALEALIDEQDADLYLWVSGAREAPAPHHAAIAALCGFHGLSRAR